MQDFEKLGAFYLGRSYDLDAGTTGDEPLLYDSRDLTTHAVCVGMTGSGKTGLCLALLEEAAIDGLPAVVIDPKGDLGNLLLTFPELRDADFLPWVDPDDARRKGVSVETLARDEARKWREGLAQWGQDGARIQRLRDAAEFTIYTPGSDAGRPVSILASFAAPPEALRADGDLLRERVASTTTALLGLAGVEADPLRSREHILISTLLDEAWRRGAGFDLAGLIQAIQAPPVERVGVIELETFFPAAQRFELALRLNNLLAAPGFGTWLTGEDLDVGRLLHTAEGKPRIAIFSIAHLADAERMFFVSLLLHQVVGWMRGCGGTTSLRALVYMDEVFGFLPPTAEPPSKRPLLTLLKQARAYGVGVVLATQNPVDLDYKALSNAGTWFLGRLQTERDKARVLDGLEGASGTGFDRQATERTLGRLGNRVFLLHNVHEDAPVVFQTRWALSYLRGPLGRDEIRRLAASSGTTAAPVAAPAVSVEVPAVSARPVLPPSVPQAFLPLRGATQGAVVYVPTLLGLGRVQHFDRTTGRLVRAEDVALIQDLPSSGFLCDWSAAQAADLCPEDLERDPEPGARFAPVPAEATRPAPYKEWNKALADTLFRTRALELRRSKTLGLASEPGESEAAFRVRLAQAARERRDKLAEQLRGKYGRRLAALQERMRRAEQAVAREREQATGQKVQTAISFGATLLSALVGRKALSAGTLGRAATAARGVGRVSKEAGDVARAEDTVEALNEQVAALNAELESELASLDAGADPLGEPLEVTALRPRRSDVEVRTVVLAWAPHHEEPGGTLGALWR